jgi:hypothetical protein
MKIKVIDTLTGKDIVTFNDIIKIIDITIDKNDLIGCISIYRKGIKDIQYIWFNSTVDKINIE